MNAEPTPTRPGTTLSGVGALLGRVVVAALVVAAGLAGWVAIERFDVAVPSLGIGNQSTAGAASLPELGDGLPAARLASPAPWRRFALTYQVGERIERTWVDLDEWKLRVEGTGEAGTDAFEVLGDRGYTRLAGTEEWVEQDVQATRDIASWLMTGIGPFVLTDLVPPDTLGFTTLELEGTSRGERVYEVSVDAATLASEHPLAHRRWTSTTRIVNDTSGVYRIRVRADGYIVRIDGDNASVQWDDLVDGVELFSPLAASDPALLGVPAAIPAVPVAPETTAPPVVD